jgi:hypothetical protein
MGQPGWTVEDFERVRGEFPIRTFLGSLDGRNAREAAALVLKLGARGNQMRPPDSEPVTGQRNLFELRGHQVRIFYCFLPGRVIVLVDGIVKKQDRIPTADRDRMVRYRDEAERRGPRAP